MVVDKTLPSRLVGRMARVNLHTVQRPKGYWDFLGICTLDPSRMSLQFSSLTGDKYHSTGIASKNGLWMVSWNLDYSARIRVAQLDSLSVIVIGPAGLKENIAARIVERLHNTNLSLTDFLADIDCECMIMAWDDAARRGMIAADPIGRFTLYYSVSTDRIVWASHPVPVAILTSGNTELSQEALNVYFALKGIPAPFSLLKGVRKLSPGHLLLIKETGLEITEYFPLIEKAYEGSLPEAQEELICGLRHSIEQCINYSQPVGVFLSGGLDSTTLAAIASEFAHVCAFSVGYLPSYYTDESELAAETARLLDIPIEIHRFSPPEVETLTDEIVARLPEPVADMALLPQASLASKASRSVKAVLDGTGADAIFGGSNKFVAEHYMRFYMHVPRSVRRGLIYLVQSLPSSRRWPITNEIRKLQIFVTGAEFPTRERSFFWSTFCPYARLQQILSGDWVLKQDIGMKFLDSLTDQYKDQESVSGVSYMTLRGITAGVELPKLAAVERRSGIFIHTPFLSSNVVRLAFSLPDSYKVSGACGKIVLREASKRIVPQQILQRRKANFSPPIGQWLTSHLRELFWETIAFGEEFFNLETVRRWWQEQRIGWRDWSAELWAIFMFLRWWKQVKACGSAPHDTGMG